jgi:nucleoside-diphosphate-sugar epimerase
MKKIAIIGANGQVGTEVCIYLSGVDNFEVIPICRSDSSAVFLRKLGLNCNISDMEDPVQAKETLKDIDIVVDLSYPKGTARRVREITRKIISNVLRFSPPDSSFIYMSSIVAFGVHSSSPWVRRHVFSHTPYGALKRYGERVTRLLGLLNRKKIYILRLGQVHGEMQSVGRKI